MMHYKVCCKPIYEKKTDDFQSFQQQCHLTSDTLCFADITEVALTCIFWLYLPY